MFAHFSNGINQDGNLNNLEQEQVPMVVAKAHRHLLAGE